VSINVDLNRRRKIHERKVLAVILGVLTAEKLDGKVKTPVQVYSVDEDKNMNGKYKNRFSRS
jgi:hypothetical protein